MIVNFARPDPRYGGGGGLLVFTYPQRGIGSAVYREIARFTLAICRRAGFRLER